MSREWSDQRKGRASASAQHRETLGVRRGTATVRGSNHRHARMKTQTERNGMRNGNHIDNEGDS